jgi:ABC-type methionine transport system ATPase subunit
VIEIDGVGKTYASGESIAVALADVHLRIGAGEIFGVIGRSNAGKSTLVLCMNLMVRPAVGTVRIDGSAGQITIFRRSGIPEVLLAAAPGRGYGKRTCFR